MHIHTMFDLPCMSILRGIVRPVRVSFPRLLGAHTGAACRGVHACMAQLCACTRRCGSISSPAVAQPADCYRVALKIIMFVLTIKSNMLWQGRRYLFMTSLRPSCSYRYWWHATARSRRRRRHPEACRPHIGNQPWDAAAADAEPRHAAAVRGAAGAGHG